MISPNIINTIGSSIVWEMTVTNGPVANTGVFVDLVIPSEFTIISSTFIKGSLTGVTWTIGDMDVDESQKLILVLELTGTPSSFSETFEFVADVTGLDTLESNNVLTDTLQYQVTSTEPLAGAVPDKTSCLCVDVSINDTPCSQGTTEWRLDEDSIVNGVLQSWDVSTGKGNFTPIDLTKPITFTYDLFCVQGDDEYEIACDVSVEIYPQLSNIDVFDHTLVQVDGNSLDSDATTILEEQYPDLDLTLYKWNLLKNNNGDYTSGVPIPIHKELSGYLCNDENSVVFVWVIDGEVSFKFTDDTDYLGDPLALKDCCCGTNVEEETVNTTRCAVAIDFSRSMDQEALDEVTVELNVNGEIYTTSNLGTLNLLSDSGLIFVSNLYEWINSLGIDFAATHGGFCNYKTQVMLLTYPTEVDWTLTLTHDSLQDVMSHTVGTGVSVTRETRIDEFCPNFDCI